MTDLGKKGIANLSGATGYVSPSSEQDYNVSDSGYQNSGGQQGNGDDWSNWSGGNNTGS